MDEPLVRYVSTADGVSIAYWRLGHGPPLVQLPPLPHSHIRAEWEVPALRRAYELASAEMTVVRYDGRGTGLSQRDIERFSLEEMLLDLDAVVEALGAGSVAIHGAGNSGAIAIAYAARCPERVSHLLLWSPVVDGSVPANSPQLRALSGLLDSDWEMFVQTAAHTFVGWSEPETASQFAEVIRAGITPEMLKALLPAIHGLNVRDELPLVRCPTLVMHRPGIGVYPPGTMERVAARIPGAQMALFDGDSAVPCVGDWRAIVRRIVNFLDLPETGRGRAGRALRLLSMKSETLTPREREIVELVVLGLTNREIAEELCLAEKTVENHVGRILVKLDLPSRTRLAAYAVERGLAGTAAPRAASRD